MSQKILPPKLDKSKKIGIIASDLVRGVCSENVIQRGYKYLKEKGFDVVEGESVKKVNKKAHCGIGLFAN